MKDYLEAYDEMVNVELLAYGRSSEGAFWASLKPIWEEARNKYRTEYQKQFSKLPGTLDRN